VLSPPPRHVIFDLDGTLLDTESLYTEAAQRIVGRFGKAYGWDIKQHTMGGAPLAGARYVVSALGLPLTPEAYLAEREAIMDVLCEDVPACAGAVALVEALHARGVPLAIGTSGPRTLTTLKLRPHPFKARMRAIVCSDDPGITDAKPAPDIFLAAARALSADPADCLVIEDTPKGLEAALRAGMRAIVVPDRHMLHADYTGAARVVASLEELTLAWLGL
jgi:pseudouridine-5'-monophosphatase